MISSRCDMKNKNKFINIKSKAEELNKNVPCFMAAMCENREAFMTESGVSSATDGLL